MVGYPPQHYQVKSKKGENQGTNVIASYSKTKKVVMDTQFMMQLHVHCYQDKYLPNSFTNMYFALTSAGMPEDSSFAPRSMNMYAENKPQ